MDEITEGHLVSLNKLICDYKVLVSRLHGVFILLFVLMFCWLAALTIRLERGEHRYVNLQEQGR